MNNKKYPQKSFVKRSSFRDAPRERRPEVSEIINLKDKDFFSGNVKIMRRTQPGPVIFIVSDGYANIEAVTKDSEFLEGQIVELAGFVNERAGKLQIEILRMRPSKFNFNDVLEKTSKPVEKDFSIKSERLEKMRGRFIEIATRIRKAILENQPIFIRHHADSDGIISGLTLEHACKQLMKKVGVSYEYNLYRSPSRAPFYDTTDVFRDIVFSKRITESHGQKKPLFIVVDNGSTPEDVFAMKTLNSIGFEVIVIDHHNPVIIKDGKSKVCPYISLHLNPYLFGLDSQTCAGMLCYEVARLISEDYEESALPAIAGITDRSNIPELDKYIKNSKESKEDLTKIGMALDFLAYQLKFDAGKGLYEEVLTNPKLVSIIGSQVSQGIENQLKSTLPYLRTQDIEGVIFSYIDLEKYTMRFTYPNPGKVIGMIHDTVAEKNENVPVISLGILSEMIIVRATKPVLPVAKIIERLQKDLPAANIEGGGHECAGAIKFVSAHLTEVLENIKKQVKKINYIENSQTDEDSDPKEFLK